MLQALWLSRSPIPPTSTISNSFVRARKLANAKRTTNASAAASWTRKDGHPPRHTG